jgi:Protein of unknown function (DUF4058)
MPSPFPGMDPYLESQGYWQDFHTTLLTSCRRALTALLPRHYSAVIEERISLIDLSDTTQHLYRPDVALTVGTPESVLPGSRGVLATLEPIDLPLALADLDEIHNRWIEMKRLPDRSLVTVIEILSPTNKTGSGRHDYIEKRKQWINQPIHVVEIELLLRGQRLPMGDRLPSGDYFAFVSRSARRPMCEVYPWSIRRALPVIPIPLSDPDPDVALDLPSVFAQTDDEARYDDSIKYSAPLDLPLADEDRAWAAQQAQTRHD